MFRILIQLRQPGCRIGFSTGLFKNGLEWVREELGVLRWRVLLEVFEEIEGFTRGGEAASNLEEKARRQRRRREEKRLQGLRRGPFFVWGFEEELNCLDDF